MERIRKSLRDWCRGQCVIVGEANVAVGEVQSSSEIVAIFMFTSWKGLQSVNYVIVVLAYP